MSEDLPFVSMFVILNLIQDLMICNMLKEILK